MATNGSLLPNAFDRLADENRNNNNQQQDSRAQDQNRDQNWNQQSQAPNAQTQQGQQPQDPNPQTQQSQQSQAPNPQAQQNQQSQAPNPQTQQGQQGQSNNDSRNGAQPEGSQGAGDDRNNGDRREGDNRNGDDRNGEPRQGDDRNNGDQREGNNRNGDDRNGEPLQGDDRNNGDQREGNNRNGNDRDGEEPRQGDDRDGNQRQGNGRNGEQGQGDDRGDDRNRIDDGGGAPIGAIAGGAVGGVIVLALLLFFLFKRRRGGMRFRRSRPASTFVEQRPSLEDAMTALPPYEEERYSVTTSRPDVPTNFSKPHRKSQISTSPLNPEAWKSSNPVSPPEMAMNAPLGQAVSPPDAPYMPYSSKYTPIIPRNDAPVAQIGSGPGDFKGVIAESDTDGEDSNHLKVPDSDDSGRWSWTNSQAPSTPRLIAPNARESLPNSAKENARTETSVWKKSKAERGAKPKQNPPAKPRLKNQALKPILRDPLTKQKSAKRHGQVASFSSRFGHSREVDPVDLPSPSSPRLEDGRIG